MRNKIGISSSYAHNILPNQENTKGIELIRDLPIDGVEISLTNGLNKPISYELIKRYTEVSIHAPIKGELPLDDLEIIYKKLKANNIVFNDNALSQLNELLSYEFVTSIENNNSIKGTLRTSNELRNLLNKNDNLFLTLNIANAISNNNAIELINDFSDKIIEIHCSILNNNLHDFCHKHQKYHDIMKALSERTYYDVPVIIQAEISRPEEINLFSQEISYLRTI